MKQMNRFLLGSVLGLSCGAVALAQESPKPAAPKEPGLAATIDGKPVTIAELDAKILSSNMKLAQQLYDARKAAVDQVILDRAFAKEAEEKKVTVDAIVKEKVTAKAKPVSDADIQAYFNANQGRMGGKPLEQMTGQIKTFLSGQRENEARNELLAEVRKSANVKMLLDAPRVEVAVAPNDPAKGPATAKVTVIEFSEFQ